MNLSPLRRNAKAPYTDAAWERKPSGHILVDGVEVAVTRQCVLCQRHWIHFKGQKAERGFCMNCMGITCGQKLCDVCVPFERKLEAYEKGCRISLT